MVGLVTFGRMVHVHELGVAGMPRAYVFKGAKDVTKEQIQKIVTRQTRGALGARSNTPIVGGKPGQAPPPGGLPQQRPPPQQAQQQQQQQPSNKFLQPISECDMSINELIENLQPDGWPVAKGKRPQRATGAALNVAVTLLETSYPSTGARVMLFCGGACTHGRLL